ncbi:MAG TPA: thioredoxin family protein [Polyangiaceae bacterium]|nr:thioredoxin family protein [Polyangiaceae bacterium]
MKTLALGLALPVVMTAVMAMASGCRDPTPPPASVSAPSSSVPSLASASAPAPASTPRGGVLPFVENDYAAALAQARARGVPLFIDAWAPWCHTCLSMRAFVFSDPAMKPLAHRFVWLALDTEREASAPLVERLGITVLPTLFVLDPGTEAVRLAHPGSLTAEELVPVLEGVASPDAGRAPETRADRLTRLRDDKRPGECVTQGAAEASNLPPGTELADLLRAAIECARDLPAQAREHGDAREREREHVHAGVRDLLAIGQRLVSDPAAPILADDRSDLYDYLVDALRDQHRDDDAARQAQAWVAFLDGQAARASTPSARAVFDAHRLLAYTAIGDPGRAIPMLQQSERDFPDDYNPPARLGKALFDMKRYDDALASIERALRLAYGPRKLRFWSLEADVYEAKGDRDGERRALQSALDFAASVPLAGSYPKLRDAIATRLASL